MNSLSDPTMERACSPLAESSVFHPLRLIHQAAVLGAGTMGARIAAHLANAGIPVVLLDLSGEPGKGIGIAEAALQGLSRSKPRLSMTRLTAA